MSRPTTHRTSPSFAALVQSFFTEYLTQQRALSPQTVAAYRDAFVLFLDFAVVSLHKQPTKLSLQDITPRLILDFLAHLERDRGNSVRTRNARLAALRAFLKFASHRDVGALHVVEQALGVPMKRFERPMLGYLSREEILAIIGTPGPSWTSQRDHLLLHVLYNTGARVSEIIGVRLADGLEHRKAYQMRHTAATLWLASGEAPEWIARQLGHTTTEMLFRVYSRYVPNLTRNDGSAMDRLLTNTFVATPVQPTQPISLPAQMPVAPSAQEKSAPPTPIEAVGNAREVRAVPARTNGEGVKPEPQPPPISWADMANSWMSNDSSFDTAA